jgi:hypothetical protein
MKQVLTLTKSGGFIQKSRLRWTPTHVDEFLEEYKRSARAKGLSFAISDDLARHLFRCKCEYCGMPANPELNGIERIDSAAGFIEGNVATCCKFCARAKSVFSAAEYRWWLKNLRDGWKKGIYLHQKRGRPRVMKDCPNCVARMTAREFWLHKRSCKRAAQKKTA